MNIREKIRSVKSTLTGRAAVGGGGIHGSDILDALKATAGQRKKIFKVKTFIPNQYSVYLSRRDLSGLKTFLKALKIELLEEMRKYLNQSKFQLNSPEIQIAIKARHTLKPGEMEIVGRFIGDDHNQEEPQTSIIRLKLLSETSPEEVFDLAEGSNIIGRGRDTDITVPANDMLVSKHHCRIHVRTDVVLLRDLGSSNGTFLNQRMIGKEEPLSSGDQIRIGNTNFEVLF